MNWPNSTYSPTSLKIINLFDYEDIQQDDAIQNIVTRLFHDINNQMPSRVLDPESDIEITDINGERHDEFCNEPVEISNAFSRPTLIVDRFRETLRNLRQRTDNPNEVYYYHSDHLGSASWITDNTGIPIQHLQYLPFGEPFVSQRISGYNERFTFTGNDPRQGWRTPLNNIIYSEQRDEETGYNYHGARYYDASLLTGWLSVDPLADKYSGISPYAYCTWNPIRIVDPDGRDGWDKVAGLCIGVVTNAVPGMGGLRDAYTPTNPIDYNNALRVADNTSLVVGGLMMTAGAAGMAAGNTMMGTGAAIAVSGVGVPEGAVVVVAGGAVDAASTILGIGGAVMTARAASNSSKGYNRGSGKIESSRLTNKEVAREAEKMKMKTTKYRSHGEPVYKKGNRYYSYDNTSHKGGMWKVFELKNEKLCRIGTANKKLEIIGE